MKSIVSSSPASAGRASGPKSDPIRTIPASDPPCLEVLRGDLDDPSFTQAFAQPGCGFARGHDDIVPPAEHRRCEDEGVVAVLGGCAAEDGDDHRSLAAVVQLDVGGQHVGSEDRVDGLRLPLRLEEKEGAVRSGDVEVCPDPAGRGKKQGATALSG